MQLSIGCVAGNRPENDLLLCCSRTNMDAQTAERVRALLQNEIDWEYLLRTSISHGVVPLLYRSLSSTCPEAIPEGTMRQMREYSYANALRNLFLTRELLEILNAFDAHGVPAVPLRGPSLAASVYGDVSLRQFCDLDILVPREHVARAKELLLSRRYRPHLRLTRRQEACYVKCQHHYGLLHADGRGFVELHWRIAPAYFHFPVHLHHLWHRLQPITLSGTEVVALSREDLLLILCGHASKHFWAQLKWVCDVAELIRVHEGMNWQRVMDRAKALRGERNLFLGLFLAKDLLGATLPEEVLRTVKADLIVRSLGSQVRKRLFQTPNSSAEILNGFLFHLRMTHGIPDQLRCCLRWARRVIRPTCSDWEFLRLPDSLFFLYYVVRPIRIGAKYGGRFWRRLL